MVVIAAAVGGYILAHENLKLPGLGAGPGPQLLHAEGRVPDRPGGHARARARRSRSPAPRSAKSRASTCTTGSPTVTMKVTPKYARFYHNATLLLRPKTQLQDITVEVNPGTPSAGKLHERRNDPALADRAEHQLRRIPRRRSTPKRAPTCRSCWRAPAKGFEQQRQGAVGDAQALRPDRPLRAGDRRSELQIRHANIARSIHNFRLLMRSARRQGHPARRSSSTPPTPCSRTFAKEDANLQSTLHLLPGALAQDRRRGWASSPTAANVLGPTLHELQPFASALGPRAAKRRAALARTTTPIIKNEIRPFAREILPVVNELEPATKQLAEAFPKLATQLLGAQRILQRARLQPRRQPGRLPVLPRLGEPQPQQRRQHRRRPRPARAQPDLLQLQRAAAPRRRRGSQPER